MTRSLLGPLNQDLRAPCANRFGAVPQDDKVADISRHGALARIWVDAHLAACAMADFSFTRGECLDGRAGGERLTSLLVIPPDHLHSGIFVSMTYSGAQPSPS